MLINSFRKVELVGNQQYGTRRRFTTFRSKKILAPNVTRQLWMAKNEKGLDSNTIGHANSDSENERKSLVDYPTEDQIIRLNKKVLQEIKVKKGDAHKILSSENIKEAIEQTRSESGDLYDKAATLLIALVKGHPFESGNRRTAVATTEVFLEANGIRKTLPRDRTVLVGVREGFYTKLEIKEWLQGNAIRPFHR